MTQGVKPSIYEALAAAKAETEAVGKNSRNQQQGFNFRGVDAVVNAAAGPLNKHGVIVVPILGKVDYETVEVGQKRTPMAHVRLEMAYRFYGPDGSFVEASVPAEAMDSGDKTAAKAASVAFRIVLLQVLNLPTDDRDPDADTYERSPQAPRGHQEAASGYEDERYGSPGPAARPAAASRRQQPARDVPPIDEEAQELATLVLAARNVTELRDIHTRASLTAKLSEPVQNPSTGNIGGLGKLIAWRKGVLEDEGKALAELMQAAKEAGVPDTDIDGWVQKVASVDVETANAAQLRATAVAMRTHK